MSNEQLDLRAVESRLKAASQRPWTHVVDGPMFCGTADCVTGPEIEVRGRVYRGWPDNYNPQVEADAKFIAHAPEDVAVLLAHCRALVETLKAIAAPDDLLEANEGAFNIHAARRMQAIATEALKGITDAA